MGRRDMGRDYAPAAVSRPKEGSNPSLNNHLDRQLAYVQGVAFAVHWPNVYIFFLARSICARRRRSCAALYTWPRVVRKDCALARLIDPAGPVGTY